MKLLLNVMSIDDGAKCSTLINELFNDISFQIDNESTKLEIEDGLLTDIQRVKFKDYIVDEVNDIINNLFNNAYNVDLDNVATSISDIKKDLSNISNTLLNKLKEYKIVYIYLDEINNRIDDNIIKSTIGELFDDKFWFLISGTIDEKVSIISEIAINNLSKIIERIE